MDADKLEVLLNGLLQREPRASELNFTPGCLPHAEVDGSLRPIPIGSRTEPLNGDQVARIAKGLLRDSPALLRTLEETGAADCAYETATGRRFRINVFRVKGNVAVVMRALAADLPSLKGLGLPPVVGEIAKLQQGLALVTGATGSGKSTTLAAIVDRINEHRPVHVVTLEDPVEFAHPHKKAIINQRELLLDFSNFADGLRSALRQAPKVILVGEMRDSETVEIALKAAETGHLVLSTLHTINAGQTVNRILNMFSGDARQLVRVRLAETLRFVVAQRLMPRVGQGRVAAIEVMGTSLRVRELITNGEEADRTFQAAIEDGKPQGWQSFDQHIVELFRTGQVTDETARAYCTDASSVNRAIDRVKTERGEDTSDLGELEMARPRIRR
ncbi:MAG: PilT/PilU family type 4a pilus ATPase [Planctomycetota bacterium]